MDAEQVQGMTDEALKFARRDLCATLLNQCDMGHAPKFTAYIEDVRLVQNEIERRTDLAARLESDRIRADIESREAAQRAEHIKRARELVLREVSSGPKSIDHLTLECEQRLIVKNESKAAIEALMSEKKIKGLLERGSNGFFVAIKLA